MYYPSGSVTYDYDLVVIGSGPAGEWGAVTAARMGKRVLVVDKAPEPGGAAVHTGTLPSKTLRETALFLSGREQREVYGVGVTIDEQLFVPKLLSRKAAVRRLEVERIRRSFKDAGVTLLRAQATVAGPNAVRIEPCGEAPSSVSSAALQQPREVTTQLILIATGSVPHRPAEIPWADAAVEDSDTILELDTMPDRLVVVGACVIGCEYASMFAALGVKVTLLDKRNELLPFLDRDMSEALRVAFVAMGIDVKLEDAQEKIRRDGSHLIVDASRGGAIHCDKLLFCGGRSGATLGLGLEQVGVKLGPRGSVAVDDKYVSNIPSILAAGDVIGFPALASTSMEQGRVAMLYAFGGERYKAICDAAKKTLPYGIYTIPEVSCVGLSEEDAIAAGTEVVVGKGDFDHNARAKINGFSRGFVKLVFEKKSRVCIGAHAIGDRATELIHIGQACIALKGTADAMSEMVFNYPTLSECFQNATRDALARWP